MHPAAVELVLILGESLCFFVAAAFLLWSWESVAVARHNIELWMGMNSIVCVALYRLILAPAIAQTRPRVHQ